MARRRRYSAKQSRQVEAEVCRTMTLDDLIAYGEDVADAYRDAMEIAREWETEPGSWEEVHDEPMPGPPRSRAAWRRHDRQIAEYEIALAVIDAEMDTRGEG